ncbi:MAG: PLP-dependent transferase [Bacteroidota bacterium]
MAAISNLVMAVSRTGNNIITSKHLFGNTLSLFEKTLKPYGFIAKYTDLTDPAAVDKQVDKDTVAIFFETITNPQLEVANIRALSEIAKKNNILLIADTTLTPPSVFSAREFGIDMEVLSSTKYISGGATSVGGLLVDYGTFDWSRFGKTKEAFKEHGRPVFKMMLRKQIFRNLGACLSPHNAYLQSLGLDTLVLRTERSTSNALELARWLEGREAVRHVHHPGLESSKKEKMGLRDTMIRLSVGIEEVEDLIEDFRQVFTAR